MRATFLFILSLAILALTSTAWYHNLSRLDNQHSAKNRQIMHDKIDRIRSERDIDILRNQAVDLIIGIDEFAQERERGINKGQNFLFLAMFLSFLTLIISFLEVASRGKKLMEKANPKMR